MQMRGSDVYPSKFLKAEDFQGDVSVIIEKVEMETFTDPKTKEVSEKPLLWIKDCDKAIILNKTNWALIARQHGDESDAWVGKTIILGVLDVEAFGDVVSAIRVKPPKAAPKTTGKTFGQPVGNAAPTSEAEAAAAGADEAAAAERKQSPWKK